MPGLNNQRASFSDPEEAKEALAKISDEYHQNPTEKNRQRYIKFANEVAEARVKK
ncbi:hypothetical protein [Rickettsiella massiliensis]|uniref:hypothetical protein n=1 Tax=Rickettsiella massiliensis TaxID=676517 RepID=UPI0002D9A429|nr:hypothetical protein [Rickettsiella massiliensis]